MTDSLPKVVFPPSRPHGTPVTIASMSDERKRPMWPWIVVLVPVLYVASFGPASWLASWEVLPLDTTSRLYLPIFWADDHAPLWLHKALAWYTELGEFADGTIFGQMYWSSGAFDLKMRGR